MIVLDAAFHLVGTIKKKITGLLDPYPAIFTSLMSVLLEAISKNIENGQQLLDRAIEVIDEAVNHWITGTIGSDVFGKEVTSWSFPNKSLMKLKEEFEVKKL